MLFLVSLADRGIPDGAYLLSKLYSRGLVFDFKMQESKKKTLVTKNLAKAAVWT